MCWFNLQDWGVQACGQDFKSRPGFCDRLRADGHRNDPSPNRIETMRHTHTARSGIPAPFVKTLGNSARHSQHRSARSSSPTALVRATYRV